MTASPAIAHPPSSTSGGRPPRVLLLTDSDVFAGTERHILELAEGLRALDVPVRIGCPAPSVLGERAAAARIPTVTIQKGGLYDAPAIRILTGLLRAGEIDLIHAHNGRTGLAAAVSTWRAGLGRTVATQHFITPGRLRQGAVKRALSAVAHGWTNARIAHFVAISGAVRDAMLARGDAGPERITVVPNGLSVPAPRPGAAARVRAEFYLAPGTPLVVCVARLEREKDLPTLLAALPAVARAVPGVRCLIVGDGADRAALAQRLADLGLAETVTLTGFRPDPLDFIAAAEVFVLPSPAEPFGLAILEAMALGRPVVAMDGGGPREIVVEGETGRLVAPGDPAALATALTALLRDATLRARLGERGRARFDAFFTTGHMARATLDLYERVGAAVAR